MITLPSELDAKLDDIMLAVEGFGSTMADHPNISKMSDDMQGGLALGFVCGAFNLSLENASAVMVALMFKQAEGALDGEASTDDAEPSTCDTK